MQKFIDELIYCLEKQSANTRLMHRIKAFSNSLDEHDANTIETLVDRYDELIDEGDYEKSLDEMEKLTGFLEGLNDLDIANPHSGPDPELLPQFELGKDDKVKVLKLCADMRKIVISTDAFDQPHKRRLLNRIAGIEFQVEQPKGLLDVIRAGVSDIGETLGKFGTDIKPLTDRMNEVAKITRSNSKEYEKIPAPEEIKQLPKPEESLT
ncbi:hypothetical protein [Phaeobacter inhibens]|uniref:hypothetical protein n=1 Tax=Phaeobacter inhibens TaxID=221822 RepID=UPI0021A45E7E|nr:hypothetical protein [Phaeobacter inhibens]UWR69593.1 hypothetical protein K4K95_05245 [Phaeobacter inhibens]UWR73563.1 hypothetical protein K4L00_05490 [Phaeobacter inhibens]